MIEQTHPDLVSSSDKPFRYADTRFIEKERGDSIMAMPVSLPQQGVMCPTHLAMITSPMKSQVTAAMRWPADGMLRG